ncbi:MAG TPA: M48 family metallopeptidase, partial [Oleiagrimonas sp.]|nr:M48 family metallopeptidase [Oleiagrimonas sp.]
VGMVSIAVLVLIVLASMYRMASLRGGGATVAQGMSATPVPADTTNPAWRRLRNVIEEIAIASSVPVPDIYVMEQETGINAFAAGYTPSDAAVCVTQGCLERLTRDELQGVIAHEFSHVLNGDMRLNIRLMGLLFGILVIGIVGRFMLYSGGRVRSRDNNGTASLALIGIAVVIVGYIGFFFGRLIQAAVSRSRESLADASAVQFTRQTSGIAGALKKIAALQEGSQLAAHNKQEVAHMLFGEAGRFSSLFATHPPLPERLQALGVKWDEREIEAIARAWQQPRRAVDPDRASASTSVAGFAPQQVVGMAAAASVPQAEMPEAGASWHMPQDASGKVGQPAMADFDLAGQLRDRLPTSLRDAAKDPHQARALLLALAMDRHAEVRDAQLLAIDHALGSDCAEDADRMLKALVDLHPMQRLPLAALLFPALRRRPRPELEKLLGLLDKLIRADNQVDLHEYCLVRLLHLQLRDLLNPSAGFTPGRHRLRQRRTSFAALCAIVAASGDPDMQVAQRAYLQAMNRTLPDVQIEFAVPDDWQGAMDKALSDLDSLRAADKQLVVDGLATAIAADGMVTVEEAELLRVICAALHCPLPLLHAGAAGAA